MLSETIRRIGELQRSWSSKNTPEMAERGVLIRDTMVAELGVFRSQFVESISAHGKQYGDDLGIIGRDGTGNKVPAPWVRIFSEHMSPRPNTGFYLVCHFSIDGKSMFLTIGCPATKDDQKMTHLSEKELRRQTSFARTLLDDSGESYSDFLDPIDLGESTPLARSFELSTVIAKQFNTETLDESALIADTNSALKLLSAIYVGQEQGKHLAPADIAGAEVDLLVNPPTRSLGRGQGYGLDGEERKVVEIRAMQQAASYLELEGYTVTDKSANESYDLLAEKDETKIKIEVKGTTSKRADSFLMTRNEVALHQNDKEHTGLIIVYDISLKRGTPPEATDGLLKVFLPWNVSGWKFEGHTYQVSEKD